MLTEEDVPQAAGLSLRVAADLQDHLLTITHDLDRLQTLLADACNTLMRGFHGTAAQLQSLRDAAHAPCATPQLLDAAMSELGGAVVALQFQDMASQLIAHTHRRLRTCVDQLALQAFAEDGDEPAPLDVLPLRPNPVTQDEMDAGSVELF